MGRVCGDRAGRPSCPGYAGARGSPSARLPGCRRTSRRYGRFGLARAFGSRPRRSLYGSRARGPWRASPRAVRFFPREHGALVVDPGVCRGGAGRLPRAVGSRQVVATGLLKSSPPFGPARGGHPHRARRLLVPTSGFLAWPFGPLAPRRAPGPWPWSPCRDRSPGCPTPRPPPAPFPLGVGLVRYAGPGSPRDLRDSPARRGILAARQAYYVIRTLSTPCERDFSLRTAPCGTLRA